MVQRPLVAVSSVAGLVLEEGEDDEEEEEEEKEEDGARLRELLCFDLVGPQRPYNVPTTS